jgi:P27 family predicted phage terminase small subunit
MPGPPKKPTALKLVEGTYREDRVAKNEPRPKVAIPKPPKHMSALALEEWNRIVEELRDNGLMTNLDRAALVTYCEMWANYVTASEKVKKTGGMVIQTTGGNFMDNPYFSAQKRSAELMHKFLIEFGMTPASRTRISAPLSKNNNEKDDSEEQKYFGG